MINYLKIEQELICHMFFDGPVWDGNLISKEGRDRLVDKGLVERRHGYQWLTASGIDMAHSLKFTNWKTNKHPLASEMWKRYLEDLKDSK
jgi:hypothetical protein